MVVEGSADYYSSRIPKRQRKNNVIDELLSDAEFRRYALFRSQVCVRSCIKILFVYKKPDHNMGMKCLTTYVHYYLFR